MAYGGPIWVGKSTANFSSATFNITFANSGRVAGDRLFIAVETANQAIAAPSGFTEVATYSPQGIGTAGAAGGARLTLFEKTSNGAEGAVTIADSGDHQYAVGFVIRGSGGVVIAAGAAAAAPASTACEFGGLTTPADDCLVVQVVVTDRDSSGPSFSAESNPSLDNFVKQHDAGTTTGQGGGVAFYSGERPIAGTVASTSATHAASASYAWITLALRNAVTDAIYKGSAGRAARYQGARTDAQLYLGAKTLFA